MSKTTDKLGKPIYTMRTLPEPTPEGALFSVTLNSRFQKFRQLGFFKKVSDAVATKYRDSD